ncbi:MAG: hypothetical protein E3J87_00415 [Candidatus Cloacimonadota bacterium]|nr:MAG: hypothetical protein E3J87_00415 [Candidatus Cloacimonadota bacterium]
MGYEKRRKMRRFSFSMHPILRFPWEILLFLCGIGLILGIVTRNIDAILPSLVGGLILFLFFSMKRFSFIDITDNSLRIKLGCLATSEIRFSNIKDVSTATHKAIYGIGVRACGRGETAIVTNTGDVVRLQFREKGSLKLFGIFKISFISLRLSPESQTEFIEILQFRIH